MRQYIYIYIFTENKKVLFLCRIRNGINYIVYRVNISVSFTTILISDMHYFMLNNHALGLFDK